MREREWERYHAHAHSNTTVQREEFHEGPLRDSLASLCDFEKSCGLDAQRTQSLVWTQPRPVETYETSYSDQSRPLQWLSGLRPNHPNLRCSQTTRTQPETPEGMFHETMCFSLIIHRISHVTTNVQQNSAEIHVDHLRYLPAPKDNSLQFGDFGFEVISQSISWFLKSTGLSSLKDNEFAVGPFRPQFGLFLHRKPGTSYTVRDYQLKFTGRRERCYILFSAAVVWLPSFYTGPSAH